MISVISNSICMNYLNYLLYGLSVEYPLMSGDMWRAARRARRKDKKKKNAANPNNANAHE